MLLAAAACGFAVTAFLGGVVLDWLQIRRSWLIIWMMLWLLPTAGVGAVMRGALSLNRGHDPDRFSRAVFAAVAIGWMLGSTAAVAAAIWLAMKV